MRRSLLLAVAAVAGFLSVPEVPAYAEPGCAPTGSAAPAGASAKQVDDLDGDGRADALWIADVPGPTGAPGRFVGITTASDASSAVQISTGSPLPLQALVIDAQHDGNHQVVVSYGRGANLYAFVDCRIQTVVDAAGAPFVFDLQNLRGTGTGVGCSEAGHGSHLVGLQALGQGDQWTVRRTEINLDRSRATVGRSDTVTASSAQDPVVTAAQTISCGDLDIDQDGVHER